MTALSDHTRTGAITLADIARRARVSPITASRALRGSSPVAQATRERVLAAATELGYAPNLLARGLVQNRTSTVGVVIHELANPFFAPMVSAIETVAAKRGFLVVIGESGRDEEGERRYVERFQQLRIGGIIITPVTPRVGHLAAARAGGTPVVVMARRWEDGDYVTADNLEGGRLVARHLLERGHRRIGLVCPEDPGNTAMHDRVLGFREVLASAGIIVPDRWDVRTHRTWIEDGMEAADRLLAISDRPSALFVTADRKAMGLVHRLLERGLRVPDDIAVAGYDDIPFAACTQVPLTTVAIPMRRMGELSAEILFDRLDGSGPKEHRQVLLLPELVIRGSSP
jgi:LacI family transcriptional regulator